MADSLAPLPLAGLGPEGHCPLATFPGPLGKAHTGGHDNGWHRAEPVLTQDKVRGARTQARGRLQGEPLGCRASSQDRGVRAGDSELSPEGLRAVLPSSPPTKLLSPSQVTVFPAPATMAGHAWRRRRGSAAYVCLAMGGTCAMLVSVLRGGGGVG